METTCSWSLQDVPAGGDSASGALDNGLLSLRFFRFGGKAGDPLMAWRKSLSTLYTWTVVLLGILAVAVFHISSGSLWSDILSYLKQDPLKVIALITTALLCITAEWMIIRLPRGDTLTISFVLVMLTLLIAGPVEAVEVIVAGSFIGYGLLRRQSLSRILFYSGHYALSGTLAGWLYVLAGERIPYWGLKSISLPAVGIYFLIYASCSQLLIDLRDRLILPTEADVSAEETKLPRTTLLIAFLLIPLPLLTYYFYYSRDLSIWTLIVILVPLFAVLVAFRAYINIDTAYDEVKILYDISQEFAAVLSQETRVQTVARSIAANMKRLISYDACLVYSLEEDSNTFGLVYTEGQRAGPDIVKPGQGFLGRVAVSGKEGLEQEISAARAEELRGYWSPKSSLLALPLRAETAIAGLILLVKFEKPFSPDSLRLSKLLSNQAVTALRNAQIYEQTLQLAETDRLVGLMNQPAFRLRAQSEIAKARQDGRSAAIILTDVDDFKKVNTAYGHQGGDAVLKGLADVLARLVGEEGIVGRYGGEEFAIMLPGASEARAEQKAEEIRQAVESHDFIISDSVRARATISLGVAMFPQDGQEIPDLIEKADRAAYLAKRMGKNRVYLYGARTTGENL